MAIIKPFEGITYNLEKVLLKQVISPVEKISEKDLIAEYSSKSDYNISNLMLENKHNNFNENSLRYKQWKKENVLLKANEHAFYLYEQEFTYNDKTFIRTGLVCLKKINLNENNCFTYDKESKNFNKNLDFIKSTKTNFTQILGLFKDTNKKFKPIFSNIKKNMPILSTIDDQQIKNTLWIVDDEETIKFIQDEMRDKNILIADGYETYQAAVEYCKYMRDKNNDLEDDLRPYDFVMITLFDILSDGIKLFNYSRVLEIKEDFDTNDFMYKLENYFEIIKITPDDNKEHYGIIMNIKSEEFALIVLDEILEKLHPTLRKLDSYVLHKIILEDILSLYKGKFNFKLAQLDEIKDYENQITFKLIKDAKKSVIDLFEQKNPLLGACIYTYPKLQSGLIINDL